MRGISIKWKITIWYTVVMIVLSAIVLAAMTSVTRDMVKREMENRLVDVMHGMGNGPGGGGPSSEPNGGSNGGSGGRQEAPDGAFRNRADGLPRDGMKAASGEEQAGTPGVLPKEMPERELRMPRFRSYERGVHIVLYDADGNVLEGQLPFEIANESEFQADQIREENHEGNEYYLLDRKLLTPEGETLWLRGIVPMTEELYAMDSAMRNNLILTIILILAAALGGYWIVSRAFVPVNRISSTAREIAESSDLSRRINIGKGSDEIHRLANTFDEMLAKIEQTMEREKQFTSDASHELRTPVAVILSECEYMEECAHTMEEYRESSDSVRRQAKKMSKLINELLTISRMDKRTLPLSFEETDVSEFLSFVCDEQAELHNGAIVLKREITPGIVAKADKALLARLFVNLIANAYQYSKEEGTITVSLTEAQKHVIFTVRDTGIGIAEENLPQIWNRFYQVNPARTNTEDGGAGLGLSMVKWIAESHDGTVTAKSVLGEGSEFRFEFPKQNDREESGGQEK